MYKDIDESIAGQTGVPFTERFVKGLPIGLRLSNGVIVEEST